MEFATERKMPSPVPLPPTKKIAVMQDEEPAEWGKCRHRGLSEPIRQLMQQECAQRRRLAPADFSFFEAPPENMVILERPLRLPEGSRDDTD